MAVAGGRPVSGSAALIEELAGFSRDPLGFVIFAFPWGEPGSELTGGAAPEPWQERVLRDLGEGLITTAEAVRLARTSGHGIGKSALVSWIILWAIATFEDTRGVVTANTETQLKTKTWVELAKWYRMFIGRDLFQMTATALFSVDPEHSRTWRIDLVPWSERNTEAFAGLHNQGKRILVVFDEASSIPDVIWETTEGALTDRNTEIVWLVTGNPTRNRGRFRDCFQGGRFAHRWRAATIDSRTVSFTDKEQIAAWVADYGEDSDFVRVRVRGVFPRMDAVSFIPEHLAREAVNRAVTAFGEPVVIGVDVARFGDDASVIYPRKGRDASTLPVEILRGVDTMTLASRVAATFLRYSATVVMVDEGGVGGGVVDRLRQLRIPVMGVNFGARSDGSMWTEGVQYANKRAEIWGSMREWLRTGSIPHLVIDQNVTLVDELTGPTYGMTNEAIQLERKEDMRRRGQVSPNVADALACTFAFPVWEAPQGLLEEQPLVVTPDYNPFERERVLH